MNHLPTPQEIRGRFIAQLMYSELEKIALSEDMDKEAGVKKWLQRAGLGLGLMFGGGGAKALPQLATHVKPPTPHK